MTSNFKLTGLSRPESFTCEPLHNENIFWAKNGLSTGVFDDLFKYCKDNWKDKKIAVIKHDGITEDGTPINPIVIEVFEKLI